MKKKIKNVFEKNGVILKECKNKFEIKFFTRVGGQHIFEFKKHSRTNLLQSLEFIKQFNDLYLDFNIDNEALYYLQHIEQGKITFTQLSLDLNEVYEVIEKTNNDLQYLLFKINKFKTTTKKIKTA